MAARLRALRRDDAPALQQFRVENREFLRPREPVRDESYYTLEAAERPIETQEADREADRGYAFGIFAGDALVGDVNLNASSAASSRTPTSATRSRRRQTGAATRPTRCGRRPGSASRSSGCIASRRRRSRATRSIRVLEKAGFRREGLAERYLLIAGTWEDHVQFARTSDVSPGSGRTPRSPR